MNITKTQDGDVVTLALKGRLDTTTAPQLQGVILEEFKTAGTVRLDFIELVYVSSAGLRVLLLGEKTAKSKQGKQILANVSADIMEVFEMTGFSSILNFES